MKRSELIQWLNEEKTRSADPEVELWISETEKVRVLSVYADAKDTKIFIDVALE